MKRWENAIIIKETTLGITAPLLMPIRFGIYNRILGDTGVPGEAASTRCVTVWAEV